MQPNETMHLIVRVQIKGYGTYNINITVESEYNGTVTDKARDQVTAIPEFSTMAVPVVMTLVMAVGMAEMSRRKKKRNKGNK